MTEDQVKPNGCYAESGYDFFEQQVREEFEEYARRQGYDITRVKEYSFFYADGRTEDAWRMYHVAHVRGREFILKAPVFEKLGNEFAQVIEDNFWELVLK